METTSVRVTGLHTPAYFNGRSREMLIEAFRPARKPAPVAPKNFISSLRDSGMRPGEGVPFAALYMTRARKKTAGLHAVA